MSYNSFPLGIILENGNEVYYESAQKISSLAFFNPGIILGLWENMDESESHFPRKIWNVSSGSRSLIMLPKISDNIAHEKLKQKYQIKTHVPQQLSDHAKIFAAIANSKTISCDWKNTVIFLLKIGYLVKKKKTLIL